MAQNLTKELRETILKKLMTHTFEQELKVQYSIWATFADKVYSCLYTEDEFRLMTLVPESWIRKDDDFQVQFGGDFTRLAFNGNNHSFRCFGFYHGQYSPDRVYKPLPECNTKLFGHDHDLTHEFLELQESDSVLHEKIHAAQGKAKAALESVKTVKKLLEMWPEVEPFVPDYAKTEIKANVPALPIDELNAAFGLKKKEEANA